jgi:LacI family transcriptional regulator
MQKRETNIMATIRDVAKIAQVSISTVSRVLNGTAFVNDEVKKRVEEAMQELAYQPSPAARSLRVNRSRIIGLLISDIQNPFFMSIIQGVEDETHRHDYSLLLCNSNEDPRKEQQYLGVLCAERVAGAIIVPTRERIEAGLDCFHTRNIPLVAVDRRIKDSSIDAVLVDNKAGAREAVAHLIANGYRRIGAITGPKTITTGRERLEGYRQALVEAGIPFDPLLTRSGPFQKESGWQFAQELLALTPPIDALFVGNNMIAMGALNAIHARHLRIPEDIAFVGYDELPWAAPGFDELTTVAQPVYELASTAAQRLFQRLQKTAPLSRQEVILAPKLMIRASSRPKNLVS